MHEARYYKRITDDKVICYLCPNNCIIRDGAIGDCNIRKNTKGKLFTTTYQKYAAIGFDPIEKKPLYHFYPGKQILSVGSVGCNMHCEWCQNCEISQNGHLAIDHLKEFTPQQLLQKALVNPENIGIAYTYNEPGISFEMNMETSKLFRENGLKNVMVTNGYLSQKALQEMLVYTDAINLDIKAFNGEIHKKYTGARLDQVLLNAKEIFVNNVHLELTYLVVSGLNDRTDEFVKFVKWIAEELSNDIPLHISRYFPRNKYLAPATSVEILECLAKLAKQELKYVYLGNLANKNYVNTYCNNCNYLLAERMGYETSIVGAGEDGCCQNCGNKVFVFG